MADSDSDGNACKTDHVFYRDREEWKDVEPVPQDDGPHPVVQIAYSDRFKDTYDYFRGILKSDEKSERALALTAAAADLNAANYTVWHYRRILLKSLNKDLTEELDYITEMIEDHPKNYQVWHHRMCVVDWLNEPSREIAFTASILKQDAKNYHAWQHRQWVIKKFSLWENELEFTNSLIEDDLRNNSAWNQRYFVLSNTTKYSDDVVDKECSYAKNLISKAPNNESAWNYLRGVLLERELSYPGIPEFCDQLYEKDIRSPYLLGFMVEIDQESLSRGDKSKATETLEHALQLVEDLKSRFDTIRAAYWDHIARTLKKYASGDSS